MSKLVILALGANLPVGDQSPSQTIKAAIVALEQAGFAKLRCSRFWRSPAFPAGGGPEFVNACCAAQWADSAEAALAVLHRIESDFGRRRGTRWAARSLDLDLLAVGAEVRPDAAVHDHWRNLPPECQATETPDRLVLPHPRLQDRAFVLVPMAEVAAGWRHPRTGRTVAEMLAALPDGEVAAITPL
ncbi:MAG: 2-amino-4-hydroxy-6-hydroxymethyldihydropteridine diphosphokinase [Gemmobacter sp.]